MFQSILPLIIPRYSMSSLCVECERFLIIFDNSLIKSSTSLLKRKWIVFRRCNSASVNPVRFFKGTSRLGRASRNKKRCNIGLMKSIRSMRSFYSNNRRNERSLSFVHLDCCDFKHSFIKFLCIIKSLFQNIPDSLYLWFI